MSDPEVCHAAKESLPVAAPTKEALTHCCTPALPPLFFDEDLRDVLLSNVKDWQALVRLRTTCNSLRALCTRQMATVGVYTGKRMHDFDDNGVMQLLGTAFGRRATWSLGEASARCRVTSSRGDESAPKVALHPFFSPNREVQELDVRFNNAAVFVLDKTPRRVFLNGDGIGAWFCLDFGPHVSVAPTEITLRHSSEQRRALRTFRIEGSIDGKAWSTLLDVTDDQSLGTSVHSSATWSVDAVHSGDPGGLAEGQGSSAPETKKSFRFVRITKTGKDAQSAHYMHLSGVEIYGYVRVEMDRSTWLDANVTACVPVTNGGFGGW